MGIPAFAGMTGERMSLLSHPSLSLLKESEKGEAPSNVVKIS